MIVDRRRNRKDTVYSARNRRKKKKKKKLHSVNIDYLINFNLINNLKEKRKDR